MRDVTQAKFEFFEIYKFAKISNSEFFIDFYYYNKKNITFMNYFRMMAAFLKPKYCCTDSSGKCLISSIIKTKIVSDFENYEEYLEMTFVIR